MPCNGAGRRRARSAWFPQPGQRHSASSGSRLRGAALGRLERVAVQLQPERLRSLVNAAAAVDAAFHRIDRLISLRFSGANDSRHSRRHWFLETVCQPHGIGRRSTSLTSMISSLVASSVPGSGSGIPAYRHEHATSQIKDSHGGKRHPSIAAAGRVAAGCHRRCCAHDTTSGAFASDWPPANVSGPVEADNRGVRCLAPVTSRSGTPR